MTKSVVMFHPRRQTTKPPQSTVWSGPAPPPPLKTKDRGRIVLDLVVPTFRERKVGEGKQPFGCVIGTPRRGAGGNYSAYNQDKDNG